MNKKSYFLRILLLFFIFFSPYLLLAQQLPDSGFENWNGTAFNGEPQLANWNGSNVSQLTFNFTFVFKDTNGRSGNCAKLENQKVGAMGITREAPSYLTLGTPWSYVKGANPGSASAGTDGGISFTYRPDTLAVWIKRTGSNATAEDYNIVYYAWKGTSYANTYKNSDGGCTSDTPHYDEESDIRQATDGNECGTSTYATQVSEGRLNEKKVYSNWTEVKVPIKYYNDYVPEKVNVIFSAGNYPNKRSNDVKAGNALYVDDARLIYSSAIHELYINNLKYSDFRCDILEYTYTLGLGATTIPDIIAKRSGRTLSGSEITITKGTVDGEPTLITIKAEDGSSTTTYTIYFVSKQSDNSRLNDIKYNGTSIPSFNGYNVGPYNIELPYGTTEIPTIDVVKGEEKQTYEITYSSETLPCTVTVKSFAQNKNYTTVYTINFTVGKLSDNTLQNILVGGNAIPGFNPTKTNYVVELPQGTTAVPEITAVSAYPDGEQTIEHTNNGLSGTYEIKVTVPGNATTRKYSLTFKITASTNCNLLGISIGGVPLEGFSPDITIYNYELPQGTTLLPEITYTQGDEYQSIVTTSNGVNGKYSIKVTSQSGAIKTYNINFSVYKSDISTLNDIQIGGVSLDGFSSENTSYNYQLPTGTTILPEITVTKGEENETVTIVKGSTNGVTYIRVTAENGTSATTYQIAFSVQKSTDANLTDIKIDGVSIDGFKKDSLNYTYTLTADATSCPSVEVGTEYPNQTVEIISPALEGTATIKVYSETGDSYNVYTIQFAFPRSNNNYLKNIALDGIGISGFDKTTTEYTVSIADAVLPAITYEKDDTLQTVIAINDFADKKYALVVIAENGEQRTYNLTFNIAPSGNALLNDIKLFDEATQTFVSLPDFASDKFDYTSTLAWRSKTVPNIHPVVGQKGQTVTIFYGKTNAVTTLHVEAENGTTQDYTIYFPVEKSNVTTLEYIALSAGELLFDKETTFYDVTLPYGTTEVPAISWAKSVEEQTVTLIAGSINETTRFVVTAENGDTRTYEMIFNVAKSGKENVLASIVVEGIGSFTDNAEVMLPYGTTELPAITCVKNFPEQTVLIDNGGIYAPTTITVKANEKGVADKVYTLTPKIALPTTSLSEIKVNGVAIDGFAPDKYAYVVNVDNAVGEQPAVSYTNSDDAIVETLVENTKHVQLKVSDKNDPAYPTSTYDIYFYYPSDVIPNGDFEDWTGTVYNGASKPTEWAAPADVAEKYTVTSTYYTGKEVSKSGNYLSLKSYWKDAVLLGEGNNFSIAGTIPGMITTGKISLTLASGGGSTSSVNEFTDFRNTPDFATLRYNPVSTKKIKNIRAIYTFVDEDDTTKELIFTDSEFNNTWKTAESSLISKNLVAPKSFRITLNAAHTENASDLGGVSGNYYSSEMLVDYVRFKYSSALTNFVIDGASNAIGSSFDIAEDYQGVPAIAAIGEVPDQEHTITIGNEAENGANMTRTVTIRAKAEDGTYTDYTFTLNRPKSSNNQLKALKINGVDLVGFAPDVYTYNYPVANGTTRTPDIEFVRGSMHQNVSINTNGITAATIVVTPENGGTTATYTINFVEAASDVTTLNSIAIEGEHPDFVFDANTTEYNINLAADAAIPMVSFEKNSDGQNVTLTLDNPTTLKVVAENGVNEKLYTINFTHATIATDAKLASIAIDNQALPTFSSDVFLYEVERTSSDDIYLTYVKTFVADSLATIIYADSVVWKVENKAAVKNSYKLTLTDAISSDAYLNGILSDDVLISGFRKDSLNYEIVSDTIPDISVEKGNDNQVVGVAIDESQIIITVTAENGITYQIYTIDIVSPQPKSDNALLKDIEIGGTPLPDFDKNTFEYNYELPMHTTTLPVITAFADAVGQNITITTNGTQGVTTIVVVAENGIATNTYSIAFSVTPCDNSVLNDIQLDGESISTTSVNFECDKNFAPDVLEYSILLPKERITFPEIGIVSNHEACQSITKDTTIISEKERDIKIKVVAENNVDSTIYLLHIAIKKSDNALLAMIYKEGEEIAGFDENVFAYVVNLPYGTTQVPNIICKKQEDVQTCNITPAASINEETTIEVVAENGIDRQTYTIAFNILPSSDATLSGIYIGGELISTDATGFICNENFASETWEYYVSLPVGTTVLPEITWSTSVPDITSATIVNNGVKGDAIITIVAQDGNIETYTIHFDVLKSGNNKLANLLVEGVTIGTKQNDPYEVYFGNDDYGNIATTFNPDSTIYTLVYPVGTDSAMLISQSDIDFVYSDTLQTAVITQTKATEFLITVTAENGVQNIYVISTKILLSNNSLLKDIKLNGISIDGFEPTIFNYEYLLYQGDTIPSILPIKQEASQTTSVLTKPIGDETIITCQAEDLSTSQYRILFKYSTENPGDAPTIEDICWTALGGGRWKASSKRNNVYVYIFDPSGRMLDVQQVPVLNPNSDLCSKDSNGAIFQFEKKGQVRIYMFSYNMKKRLFSGKILY